MSAVLQLIRGHRIAVALAILTAVIVASPQIAFRIDHRDDGIYQGIELLPDSFWSPRVREVQDGYPNFGSIYWKEGKDSPYLKQPLGSMIVGYMGEIFSFDINNTLLLSRLVLTFVTFLLIYSFVLLLSESRAAGLASASVIILANDILDPRGLKMFLEGESPVNFLVFSQPVIPVTAELPLFAFLIAFWLFLKRGGWMLGIASAVLLGSGFYNYFYLWTYLYAFGGLVGLLFLITKRWQSALKTFLVYTGGALIAIPYLINLHKVTLHPLYEEVSARIGIIYTHAPQGVGMVVLLSILVFFLLYPKENRERYLFSLALLLTPFITLNQQLITGKVMQAGHYHYYFHKPIAVILVLIAIFTFLARKHLPIYGKVFVSLIILVSVFVSVFIQYASYTRDNVYGGSIAIERQKYGPIMRWLSENADKDDVVLGNDEVSQLVTIYTPQNVFYHRAMSYSSLVADRERLLDIVFTYYRLRDIGKEEAADTFMAERERIALDTYHLTYQDLPDPVVGMPDEQFNEIVSAYQETFATPTPIWLEGIFKKYEVEYVVWDKKTNPGWEIKELPFLEEAASFSDIIVYRVQKGDTDN